MKFKDLLPWKNEKTGDDGNAISVRQDPFTDLQKRMDSMFDDFFKGFGDIGFPRERSFAFSPTVDVTENDKKIQVTAELPGIDAKDLDISLSKGVLTISGEKKSESEEKNENYCYSERSYGSFRRSVPLPCEVNENKIEASFDKGVLRVNLPKSEKVRQDRRRIAVKSA